jgi:hypothetical protein
MGGVGLLSSSLRGSLYNHATGGLAKKLIKKPKTNS